MGQNGEEFSYNIRMTTPIEVQQLMLKFNGRVDFTDAPSGFYGGLNDFFKQLAKEEDIACQWENEDPMDYPDFGSMDDHYEDVVRPFYSAWSGFATRKSHAWKDQYKLSDAPDRRIRRLMEKENKKIREDAIQEFNDAVRSLVAFVRKRDPRVANNQKSEAERQKILRDASAAQRARSKAVQQAKIRQQEGASVIPDWAQSRTKDEHEGGFSSESEVEEHEYECVVCEKTFKSEAQFNSHTKSKKHIKSIKQLRREMRTEEGVEIDEAPTRPTTQAGTEDSEHTDLEDNTTSKDDQARSDDEHSSEEPATVATNGGTEAPDQQSNSEVESDDDYAPREAVEERLGSTEPGSLAGRLAAASLDGTPATTDTETTGKPEVGKAKQKRAKKAAQEAAGVPSRPESGFRCSRCQAEFLSKTKLFDHLKQQPSHAALVPQIKGSKAGKGKKR